MYENIHSISDEEFFQSEGYLKMVTSIAASVTMRYERPVKVCVAWDEKPQAEAAYTNNRNIWINAGTTLFAGMPDRYMRHLGITGLEAHELGHCLYTDFDEREKAATHALAVGWYPFAPLPDGAEEMAVLKKIEEAFANNPAIRKMYSYVLLELQNYLEDAFVENIMPSKFPGSLRRGIELVQQCRYDELTTINQMEKGGEYKKFEIFFSALLCFTLYGTVKCEDAAEPPSELENEIIKKLGGLRRIIFEARYSPVCTDRFIAVNHIILKIWDWLEEYVTDDHEKNSSEVSDETVEEKMKSLSGLPESGASKTPVGTGKPIEVPEKDSKKILEERGGISEDAEDMPEDIPRYAHLGELKAAEGTGSIIEETYEAAPREMQLEAIAREIAEEKTDYAVETELLRELQEEICDIDFPSIHSGVNFRVMRMTQIPDYLRDSYARIEPEVTKLSKQLQRSVLQLFRDRRDGAKLKSLPLGRHIMSEALYRNDGKIFYNKKLPTENPEIAVAVLIDESGSMDSQQRYIYAMKAALVLHHFCLQLGIPVMVTGHDEASEPDRNVELFAYADFDKPDFKNQYRLMDVRARNNNRDGAALRYVGEKLLKRSEQNKLLVVISDGEPAAVRYSGMAAEADLQFLQKELSRKGVLVFAAAIGDDKPSIQRCYSKGFLDITDLNKLPATMVGLIKRYIK